MSDARKVPEGRLGRLTRLASVGLKTGAGLLRGKAGAAAAAEQAAEVLGTLRGLAAKVGQMASYVDGVVPEAHREAYEGALSRLRAQAPRSGPEEVRALVEAELGAPLEALFAEWEESPMASASIGQVHRARLEDGTEVAVKVQHPGIERAVESDLANASILEGLAGALGGGRMDPKGLMDQVRARFREELDYAREADQIERFTALHASEPRIVLPRVFRERSSRRVLTTALGRGLDFDAACQRPEAERHAWAETLWRFVFRGTLIGGAFNADPHPGNYLFLPDGAVFFLDFGCVQNIAPDRLPFTRRMHHAALRRDEAAFAENTAAMLRSRPGEPERQAVAYVRRCFEPLFGSPFRMTRPYAASLVDGMKDFAQVVRKADDAEFFQMPSDMLFMNRLQFGFYSVLARLDVEVDFAALERRFWREVPEAPPLEGPPSRPPPPRAAAAEAP